MFKKIMIGFAAVVALGVVVSAVGGAEDPTAASDNAASASSDRGDNNRQGKRNKGGKNDADRAAASAPEAEPEEPAMSVAQENAVRSAENYIDLSGFSRSGLIDQLEFEDYSTQDATAAVDSLNVDWNAEAAESAEGYVDMTGFSRQGLIDQLKFEGYTDPQAAYGADQVGL